MRKTTVPAPKHTALMLTRYLGQNAYSKLLQINLSFVGPCIVIYFYVKTNQMHNISNLFYYGTTPYMFRTVFPSIIRSLKGCTYSIRYMLYRFCDCLLASCHKTCMTNIYDIGWTENYWVQDECTPYGSVKMLRMILVIMIILMWHINYLNTQDYEML